MSRNNNSSFEKYNNQFSQTSAAIWYRECWCHLKKIVPRHINLGKVSLHVRESKTVLDCEFHATSHLSSLRIKRCRVVSEQRKTEERRGTVLSVLAVQKLEQEPKNERGGGLDRPIFRAVYYPPSFVCFETARKRLQRRLPLIKLKILKKRNRRLRITVRLHCIIEPTH